MESMKKRACPRANMKRRHWLLGAVCLGAGAALTACGKTDADPNAVNVITHDSFTLPDNLIETFKKETGLSLTFIPSGNAGELVNKLILTKDAPLGDAVFGIDNTFASRALSESIIDTSASVTLPADAQQYVIDDVAALAPIDFGEVCLNVDTAWFAEHNLAAPSSFTDLTKSEYQRLFVAINPSTSSAGMEFLLATIGYFGADGFADYWQKLIANGTKIDQGWTEAYYTDFSGAQQGGTYPIVIAYASSPAGTVSADGTTSSTASVPQTATRQVEYAGVLAGANNAAGAKRFIEWMLSVPVQNAIPENMYMYPVNAQAQLSAQIQKFGQVSANPIVVAADEIAANRESWLDTWTQAVGA